MNKIIKSAVIAITLSTLLAGCGKSRSTRGYYFDPFIANDILPGVDNRQSVQNSLGTPTTKAAYNDDTWYYINTRLRFRAVLRPERENRRIMAVYFDEQGVVEEVKNMDLSLAWDISPSKDKTRTRGKELNFFQQLFMNVGRFAGVGQQGPGQPGGPGPNGS